MKPEKGKDRPDIAAATRGGDWAHPMDGEGPPAGATRKEAAYWLRVYTEILAMEEKVLARIKQLMAAQSAAARREVELTNVPVVVAQVERFRQRRRYWAARASELDGANPILDGANPILDGANPIQDQRLLKREVLTRKGQVSKKTER